MRMICNIWNSGFQAFVGGQDLQFKGQLTVKTGK